MQAEPLVADWLGVVAQLVHAASLLPSDALGEPARHSYTQLLLSVKELTCELAASAERLAKLQELLPHIVRLAARLAALWRQPEQQAVEQLLQAQAAATRSCAYLRCSNVGAEGGPAAGQGLGSMRCR